MHRRWAWIAAALIVTAVAGFAQIEGVPSESDDSTTPVSSPVILRPVSIVGQILLEDGSPPMEPALVEPVCNNVVLPESYTDLKGRFSIDVSEQSGLMGGSARASGPGLMSSPFSGRDSEGRHEATVDLRGCELRVEMSGFQHQVVSLDGREASAYVDVGRIRMRRLANVEGDSISITTMQAPEQARKHYEKAVKQLSGRRARADKAADKATKELQAAVDAYPQFAAAWNLLGEIQMKAGDTGEAETAFGQALEADPAYIRPYLPLARLTYQQGRWEDTLRLSDRALRLNPYLTGAMYLQALANYQLGRNELAEKSALALQSRQDAHRFPETHYLLGLIRSQRGEFEAAAHNLREYLAARPNTELAQNITRQLEEWAALGVIPR